MPVMVRLRKALKPTLVSIRRASRGAATAEYALILALVAIALIASLTSLESALSEQLTEIVNQIQGAG